MTDKVRVELSIDNTYEDGYEVTTIVRADVPAPDFNDLDEWWLEYIYEYTGSGYGITKPNGKPRKRTLDALYTAKITQSSDPRLVGLEYEF